MSHLRGCPIVEMPYFLIEGVTINPIYPGFAVTRP
jgi:hypothetical protein